MHENEPRRAAAHPWREAYHVPRELEHPIQAIKDVQVQTLVWIQPHWLRPAYELWAGERVVATLRYRGLFLREALGNAADGLWTFEGEDPISGAVRIRARGRVVGQFFAEEHYGACELEEGRRYYWSRMGLWEDEWMFADARGHRILSFRPEGAPQARLRVELTPGANAQPDLSLLALLGKFHLMAREAPRSRKRSLPGAAWTSPPAV